MTDLLAARSQMAMALAFHIVFAAIGIALHVPLSIMLVGIVLRGAAFAFRSHDYGSSQRRWDAVFAVSSVVSPLMLGVCVGAIASGNIHVVDGVVTGTTAWWAPFPALCGSPRCASSRTSLRHSCCSRR